MLRKTGTAILAIITAILVLEGLLRLTGRYETYTESIGLGYASYYDVTEPDWYWTYPPGDTLTIDHGEFRYKYRVNQFGLREREPMWRDSAAVKLAVFGDSFTEGMGADYEGSYPRQLERRLLHEGIDISVYNAGSSGSDPFYYFTLLRDKILPESPTHVIFTVNRTEWGDHMLRGGFERFLPDGRTVSKPAPKVERIYRCSFVARAILHRFLGYNSLLVKRRHMPELTHRATEEIIACLDSANRLCSSQGIQFMVLTHPIPLEICQMEHNTPSDIERLDPDSLSFALLRLQDDLRDALSGRPREAWSWPTDGHFNAEGYTVFGDLAAEKILRQHAGWLNSGTH